MNLISLIKDFLSFCSVILISLHATNARSDHSLKQVTALDEGTISLPCDAPRRRPGSQDPSADIEWVDLVHNSDVEPQLIFSSRNNPQFSIEGSHPNADNYAVDAAFTLTISNLRRGEDPGRYICRWGRAGQGQGQHRHISDYYLSIASER